MATDLEKLVVQLSADFRQFERQMAKASGVTNKQFNAIERRARQMNKNLDGIFARSFRGLTGPLAGIGAALGTRELIQMTDTWTDLNSRVSLAAGGLEKGAEVMGRLGEVARRTYSSLEQTAEGYLLNATAMRELGYSTSQTLDYTESVNNALVISGAKGQRAATVMDALSKAMALGKLSGDNLNTVISTGGRVAEALAAGLGVSVNQLRALGSQGKITGRDIVSALSSQMEKLRKEAADMPATISDGIQLLNNALLEYVGKGDQATGVSAKISEALVIMADNFDKTADVALQLAGVIAGALIGRSLLKMISTLGVAGSALISFTRALSAARTMAGLSMAFAGLGAAAGPVGLLIGGAVVTSLIAYSGATADAAAASRTYETALEAVRAKAGEVAGAVEDAAGRIDAKTENMLSRGVDRGVSEIDRLRSEILSLMEQYDLLTIRRFVEPDQLRQIDEFREKFDDGTESVQDLENRLFALANASPNMQTLAERLSPLLVALRKAIAATDILQEKLGAPDRAIVEAYQQYGSSRVAGNAIQAEREAYEQAALRRAQLGKDQLALENEIASVRQRADKDNVQLTEDQIKRIAEANLAGNASRSKEGKKPKKERDDEYERLAERIAASTAAMVAEAEVQRQLNPLVDDYGYAVEKARAEQELLNAAKKAGVEVTPALREEIAALADQYAVATVEAAKLGETQDEIRRNAEEMAGFQKDLARGIVDGFIQGKKAADIFADALSKVGNKLLDMAFNAAFDTKGGGGFLSNLFAGMFREKGGPVKKGQPYIVGEKRPEVFVPDSNGTILPKVPSAPSMPSLASMGAGRGGSVSAPAVYHIDARGAQEGVGKEIRTALEAYDKGRKVRLAADLPELRRRGAA